ncbi:hypothetical protein [Parabacteroides distasonis]|uniref:hypothetical protein n=1 Tax=Parabacteroides distasonis TaxID=823 RepID=UPI001F21F67F|nr:hypothetical protein [Parabacteroides distasonis]MCE9060029.1 hypothetical protein [Parabacteroides distasonis]
MKYNVTYTLQREVSVIVDIKDKEINDQFKRLGDIKSDADFGKSDPRWKIEERAFEDLCRNELMPGEGIVDRSISKIE